MTSPLKLLSQFQRHCIESFSLVGVIIYTHKGHGLTGSIKLDQADHYFRGMQVIN